MRPGGSRAHAGLAALFILGVATSIESDTLDSDATWAELQQDGLSVVFGRFEGRFEGADYRRRKLRLREVRSGEETLVDVDRGLGYFHAAVAEGRYELVSVEAVYFPRVWPMRPERFPPVSQRYSIERLASGARPTIRVTGDSPTYVGTIRIRYAVSGTVYSGHAIELEDQYDDAVRYLSTAHPTFTGSLAANGVEAERFFFIEPIAASDPFALVDELDPVRQARQYLEDGKYAQAVNWLRTVLPSDDAQRAEIRLLIGEALLADGRFDDAVEEIGEVLRREPQSSRALRLLARAHARNGNAADALQLYESLAQVVDHDAEASLNLGYAYALRADAERAEAAFDDALRVNFDYLLHDLTPYANALKAEGAEYTPPKVVGGAVKTPSGLRTRRSAEGAFAILLSHEGRPLAAHLSSDAGEWARPAMMSLIRAEFQPARLNGVPIPCLIIMGVDARIDTLR